MPEPEADADTLIAQAFGLLDEDDATGAFKLGRRLEEMGEAVGFEIQALALDAQGRGVEAVEALERGVAAAPDAWLLWQQLGNLRSDASDYDGALAAYDSAAASPDADAGSVAYNRAQVLDRAGRSDEALAAIAAFTARGAVEDPELSLLIWSFQTELLNDADRHADAAAFVESLDLPESDADSPEALSRLQGEYALALARLERPAEAEAMALKAIAGAKQNEEAQWVLREVRRVGKGKRYLQILVEGRWHEPLQPGEDPPGFYATYHVVADSDAEALSFIREFEPPAVRDSLAIAESEAEDVRPQPKGVYLAHPGYTFFGPDEG